MNINNLFFYLHYCNHIKKYSRKINRTLWHHELIFIIGGKGYIIVQHKRHQFREGALLYIAPNVLYSIVPDSEDPYSCLTVHFSYVNVKVNSYKWGITNKTELLPLDSVKTLQNYYQINNIFNKLIENWIEKMPGYELITKTLFYQLLFEIFQNIEKNNQNYSTSLKVKTIIEYMRHNINTKLTLADLSELVQLSPAYLSSIFKEITGYSVIKFFNKIKIDKAKELIIEGDKKVKEIAQILGFTDEFYFSRIFKQIEGISPSKFYRGNIHE